MNGKVYVVVQGVKIAAWDGTNAAGDPVSNGEYYVKVDNVDSLGVDESISKMVMVSRSIAKIQVDIYNEAGEIVRHLYSYVDDPGPNMRSDVQLSASVIQPSQTAGAAGSTVEITGSNGMTLVWDGKSDTGAIVTNGHYQVEVHYTDGKGGEQVMTRGVIVQSTNQSPADGKVVAKPNVLAKGVTSTRVEVSSTVPYTLTANLYDVAGELFGEPGRAGRQPGGPRPVGPGQRPLLRGGGRQGRPRRIRGAADDSNRADQVRRHTKGGRQDT